MKHERKLHSQGQEQDQQQAATQDAQQMAAREFATPEEMLRHDALHTPVPPAIAERLRASISKLPSPAPSWWKRLLGGTD
jgi:hypothetical protein